MAAAAAKTRRHTGDTKSLGRGADFPARLIRDRVVELPVVEQETALRRYAGDVDIAVVPVHVAPRIDVPGIELLSRTVVEAADIEHQQRVIFGEVGLGRAMKRTVLVDGVEQHPAQREHRMLAAIEL